MSPTRRGPAKEADLSAGAKREKKVDSWPWGGEDGARGDGGTGGRGGGGTGIEREGGSRQGKGGTGGVESRGECTPEGEMEGRLEREKEETRVSARSIRTWIDIPRGSSRHRLHGYN